jgi:hypothetical protein
VTKTAFEDCRREAFLPRDDFLLWVIARVILTYESEIPSLKDRFPRRGWLIIKCRNEYRLVFVPGKTLEQEAKL